MSFKERVQPLVEVFKKNTMEIINALLIYNRPLSHLSTAPTSLLRNACFSHWLKHIWKSHYPSGVIRGCHTRLTFLRKDFTFFGGGGEVGSCPSLVLIVYVLWLDSLLASTISIL